MRVSRDHVSVEPGSTLRLRGHGILATEKDVELAHVRGSAEVTVPEGVHVVGVMSFAGEPDDSGALEIDVVPPKSRRDVVPVEDDRTYTISLAERRGSIVVTTPQGVELCRVGDGPEWWGEFTTPKGCATVVVERTAPTMIAPTPLVREDFEPELGALNERLRRKGFWLGFPRLQQIDDGRDRPMVAVEDVALAHRGQKAQTMISNTVAKHGK